MFSGSLHLTCRRRGTIPSSSIERSADDISTRPPPFAIRNVPRSRRFCHIANPSRSQYRILILLRCRLQNTNSAERVTHYWIYRWPNPGHALSNDLPSTLHRIGIVTHEANARTGPITAAPVAR